jgi:hypothetical protein
MLSSVKSVWSCLGRAELRSSSEVAPARQLPDWEMTERRGRSMALTYTTNLLLFGPFEDFLNLSSWFENSSYFCSKKGNLRVQDKCVTPPWNFSAISR